MQLLDQIPSYDTHKIAVLYVGEGQVRLLGWQGLASVPGQSWAAFLFGAGVGRMDLCPPQLLPRKLLE